LLGLASFHLAGPAPALAVLLAAMMALGAGNGAVFQLAPQRFRREIGVVTGVVGAMGGLGGFYLASTLGVAKQLTGAYQPGFLGFAALALLAQVALLGLKNRWRAAWPVLAGAGVPVRV
jgi:NNP family nitrate/nitrite transporter-like MFS transporter